MGIEYPEAIDRQECKAMARECYRLSQQAPDPELRRKWLQLAVQFDDLARDIGAPDRAKLH
jgi:hypothetical protein